MTTKSHAHPTTPGAATKTGSASLSYPDDIAAAIAAHEAKFHAPPQPVGIYGPGIHMDGIGNTELGGPTNGGSRKYAVIFKATADRIVSFRQQVPNANPGYSGGDGGTIEWRLYYATPTGPTPSPLGASVPKRYGMTRPEGIAPKITAPADWVTTPGQWYALVARNIDAKPDVNFTSIDAIEFQSLVGSPVQPRFPDGQWQALYSDGGAWLPRYLPGMTGQINITWSDGKVTGCGYIYRYGLPWTGTKVEVFTPKVDVPFTELWVRAWDNPTVTLGGLQPIQVQNTTHGWVRVPTPQLSVLRANAQQRLTITGSSNSIQKGVGVFDPSTYFTDGSVEGDPNADLQWFVR